MTARLAGWGWRRRSEGNGRLLLAAFGTNAALLTAYGAWHLGVPAPSRLEGQVPCFVVATSRHRAALPSLDMRRPLIAGLLLGVVNAVVAIAALSLVEVLTPDEFGWFAYAPLDEVIVQDPRFPWQYVAVPLALIATDLVALPVLLRWLRRTQVP